MAERLPSLRKTFSSPIENLKLLSIKAEWPWDDEEGLASGDIVRKILWMSRHSVHASQMVALRQLYGSDVVVDRELRPFDDARQIARRFLEGGYDDLVVVAPLSVLEVLCEQGIKPLWSECVEENDRTHIDFRGARGQGFRFVRFRRVKRIVKEFENAEPFGAKERK